MVWFPVVVYRWVQESIRRVPAILTRLGIFDVPNDNGQETLVQSREDEEQQSPLQRRDSQETLVQNREDEEQQSSLQRQLQKDVIPGPAYFVPMNPGGQDQHEFQPSRPVNTVMPPPESTNEPQLADDSVDDPVDDPGYGGSDAGQTGYRTPDSDSGYESMG